MIQWETGIVHDIVTERDGLQIVSVIVQHDGSASMNEPELKVKAIHYTDFFPPLSVGDSVQLNAAARQLKLGTGGYDFTCVPARHDMHDLDDHQRHGTFRHNPSFEQPNGHMMKLRYTPLQIPVLAAEEPSSPYHALFTREQQLHQTPVLIGELHSMLPAAAAWIQYTSTNHSNALRRFPNIVYVMSDGGALPISLSKHVSRLKQLGWIKGTVTYGHAFGGDIETMNKFSALIAARHILHADIIVVAMGPGIAGTGTDWGHTGLETGELINAVSVLNGLPIMMPRMSFADPRDRHVGLSHHIVTSLEQIALCKAILPLPAQIGEENKQLLIEQVKQLERKEHETLWIDEPTESDVLESHKRYGDPITTMGRSCNDDPAFFLGIAAAAHVAWQQYYAKQTSEL